MSDELLIKEALKLAESYAKLKTESRIHDWQPYDKQWEYLNCDAKYKALTAANQIGKTTTGMFEEACHLTGIYHPDWKGVRYNRPVDIWVVGETSERVRDTLQEKLFGPIGRWGTGFIPKECIDFDNIIRRGARRLADRPVRHRKPLWPSARIPPRPAHPRPRPAAL